MNVGKRSTLTLARKVGDPVPDDDEIDGRAKRQRDPFTGKIIGPEVEVKLPRLSFLDRRFGWEPKT